MSELVKARMGGASDAQLSFVRLRFWRPFEYSVRWSIRYSIAFTLLTVLIIGGGVASSVIAASGNANDTVVAILGLLVAVLAAVNRLWRPGPRASLRHQTANALRREGWNFVCGQGDYSDDTKSHFDHFYREVEQINFRVEGIDEEQPDLEGS